MTVPRHQCRRWTDLLTGPALLAVLLTISACTSLTGGKPAPIAEFAGNSSVQQWQLRGKIGIRNSRRANSAYLNWQQCDQRFDIRLSGPLGQGAAHLYGDNRSVTLADGESEPITAAEPEQLLYRQLGWQIPVSQLHYWVRGIPAPGQDYVATDNGFQQAGWQLSYRGLSDTGNYQLPSRVIAEHPRLKVTLILSNWDLQPDCEPTGSTTTS